MPNVHKAPHLQVPKPVLVFCDCRENDFKGYWLQTTSIYYPGVLCSSWVWVQKLGAVYWAVLVPGLSRGCGRDLAPELGSWEGLIGAEKLTSGVTCMTFDRRTQILAECRESPQYYWSVLVTQKLVSLERVTPGTKVDATVRFTT